MIRTIGYKYSNDKSNEYYCNSIYESIHELLSELNQYGYSKNMKIYIEVENKEKKYPLVIDTLYMVSRHLIKSDIRNIVYDLKNKSTLCDLLYFYNSLTINKIENMIETNLTNLISTTSCSVINDICNKVSNISCPIENDKKMEIKITKIKDNNIVVNNKDEDVEKEIIKKNIICEVNENNLKEKKEKEKIEQEYNIFVSEKEYTYPKIFNHFFIKKIINGWDNIPSLFIAKFPVYLYINGKDLEGNQVRENLLDSKEGFRLYKLLYDSITDDDFMMPTDENDKKIIEDFINNLPPIQIINEKDIMNIMNDPDDDLFERDNTSQCSGIEEEENNDSYNSLI